MPVSLTFHTIVNSHIKNANFFFVLYVHGMLFLSDCRHAARRVAVRNLLTRACECRPNLLYKHTIPYTGDEYIFFSS